MVILDTKSPIMSGKNILVYLLIFLPFPGLAQPDIDHWETAVFAEDNWRYRPGASVSGDWYVPDYDDSFWQEGPGGIGYADGDDNTVIGSTSSVYLRREFDVVDTSKIEMAALHADYDDAFVAYLNGVEIARANIGEPGVVPPFSAYSNVDHEAQMYQGGMPELFVVSKPQLAQLLVDGPNLLAIQVHNVNGTSSDMSSIFFLSFGINDQSTDYSPTPPWFFLPFFSSNLPLLLIDTDGQAIPDEPRITAHLGVIDNGPGGPNNMMDPFNAYDGKIAIEIKGSSSQMFPKKNYAFETQDAEGNNNNVALLGMPEENDWVLHGPYSDKSLIRNVLSYHIGRQTGWYAPRTRWCELFINGQYHGVYVLTERIKRDENRVDIAKLTPLDIEGDELTGGYIVSVDRDDPGIDDGWNSSYIPSCFYKYQDPGYDELLPVQKNYIRSVFQQFEQAMAGPAMEDVYGEYIHVDSWVDYWLTTELFKHIDGFKLSFYMYKRKDSNGGKIHFGPIWDLNLAYGNFDFGEDPSPQGWSYEWADLGFLYPFWVIDLSTIPHVQNLMRCRWDELRQAGWHNDSLFQFIDENVALIEEARIRNFDQWPVIGEYVWPNDFVGPTYESEINFLKNWLFERLTWMDGYLPGDCSAAIGTEEKPVPELKLEAFPNPFINEITFFFENHEVKNGEILLFDAYGKKVGQIQLTAGEPRAMRLEGVANGFYFYQLLVKGQVLDAGKLVKTD